MVRQATATTPSDVEEGRAVYELPQNTALIDEPATSVSCCSVGNSIAPHSAM